ncbi:MAG: DUF3048 domain-containing protein [Oscillospiraceae bacterium]
MLKRCAHAYISYFIISALFCSCANSIANKPTQSGQEITLPQKSWDLPVKEGISPLTGKKSKGTDKLPLAVMVDNVRIALPQRGLSSADIVYEMVTEGGITRLMAIYEDYANMPQVGPVRSARDQHVQLMLPLGSLFLHVGASTYAANLLEQFHYKDRSINGYYQSGALQMDTERNKTTAIEHCWFTNGTLFSEAATQYGIKTDGNLAYSAFDFADEPRVLQDGVAGNVHIRFSSYVNSDLTYDEKSNKYVKSQFGDLQIDENSGEAISFDNVIVLFTDISKYSDNILAKVDYCFGGVGYYINGGKYENIRWLKGDAGNPLRIVSADGSESSVKINTGTSYVAIVDLGKYNYFKIGDKCTPAPQSSIPNIIGEGETEAKDIP